ncbi:AP-2 complex subunit beta [Wickerhamiella sorbophila]|uniref:AP complex subunit beta n=1 Tax=Wickerhamiella sorbophila TaxID=45607 RepID=A0A2T0FD01_9ASCO|nr:AP-2 complex subunit beta [Wickerhamiella sorbophila]PRT52882.1 AP-2 complex subunit beta [Wickerhamiella sorbophila]
MSDRAASAAELRADLAVDKKDKNHKTKRAALRKVIVNMTINNTDMINLFNEIVRCMAVDDLEIKKMCFLYLETYAKSRPVLASNALDILENDFDSSSPLVRALALRTVSSVPLKPFAELTCKRSLAMLKDQDAYVRKTAVFAVAKAWSADPKGPMSNELLKSLNHMLVDQNPSVVAAAVAALNELTSHHKSIVLTIDEFTVFQFAKILPDCNEWSQVYLLNAIMEYVPQSSIKAIRLIKMIMPRLKHANAAVITAAMRTLLFLSNYAADLETEVPRFGESIDQAILLLLAKPAEIQYVMLRNCIMLLQHRPDLVHLDTSPFVIKSADPVYIKISKIEVLLLLSSPKNYSDVIFELETCIGQEDETTSRRAIKTIGRLATTIPEAADSCVRVIMRNSMKGTDYNAQEGIVAMLQILRRYPDKFIHVVDDIVSLKDTIWSDVKARTVFIWLCGQYPSIVQDAPAILSEECKSAFASASSSDLQLTLLTAAIKLFLAYPVRAKMLVPRIFEIATTVDTSPDVRDRAFMYWRLLSADAGKTRDIVTTHLPAITCENIVIDEACLEELELRLGHLSTVYLKPAASLFRIAKPMKLEQSPALLPRLKTTNLRKNAPPPTPTRPQNQMSRQHSMMFAHPPRPSLGGPTTSFGHNQPMDSPALESLNEFENDKLIDI